MLPNKLFLLTLLLVQCFRADGSGANWAYSGPHGPEHWDGVCHTGMAQSPVDFDDPEFKDFGDFQFSHYKKMPWKITIGNNGHTLKAVFHNKPEEMPSIRGAGLNDTYEFAQVHFHWGGASLHGSEHLVDGKAFPMEMHLVHFNTKYESLALAAARPDGLAVLGVFFHLSKARNPVFDLLFSGMSSIEEPDSETSLDTLVDLKSLLPEKTHEFFRYNGSLTTPPCAESVTWTVFLEPVEISESQIYNLRRLRSSHHHDYMINNFRPVCYLNDRTTYVSLSNFSSNHYQPKEVQPSYRYDVYEEKPEDVDHFFLLIMSIIIFFMQCGFAFMEAGAVRSKNTVNILIKNWLDMCLGALVYWAIGFGLTFGESTPALKRIVGTSYFFFIDMPAYKLSKWFFQFVFAATAATLVSGSLAERCNFIAYIVYSVMITGFIYPVIAHWTWHREGWLRLYGYHDFAGSGVVHLTGAICALVGCVLMGPRIGRFDKDGKSVPMPGHSVPLSALGGLILIFGFFACNGTKQGSISHAGDGVAIATAIVNTALGTSAAGLCTLIFNKTGIVPGTGGNYSFLVTMNGSLTGTVALCAGCNVFPPWGAVIVGALSGPLFLYFNYLLTRLQIDDPLDAIPVHGVGGVWGTLSVYIFKEDGILMTWSEEAFIGLGWNVVGLVTIFVWTGTTCFLMFFLLKKINMLRVETEHEFKGMDLLKHGESAYPADAWVEQQYMKDGGMDDVGLGGSNGTAKPDNNKSRAGLPPNMSYSRAASYNNPHEMFPSASRLFSGMNLVAGNVTKSESSPGNLGAPMGAGSGRRLSKKESRKDSVRDKRRSSLVRLTEEAAHFTVELVLPEMSKARSEIGSREEMKPLNAPGKN